MEREKTSSQLMQQRPRVREACDRLRDIALELGPTAKLPTMQELRLTLGISIQTLHNAIREMEGQGVLRSVHGVGIFVAESAVKEKGNLAFVLGGGKHDLQGVFWGRLFAGMRQEATKSGRNLIIIDQTVPFTDWHNVEGILVTDHLDLSKHSTSGSTSLTELPRVSIMNPLVGIKGVSADDFGGAYELTRYLISQGHRHIAYLITDNPSVALLQDRRNGYRKALEEADIEFESSWIRKFIPRKDEMIEDPDHYWVGCGKREMSQWLDEDWAELGCTALLCINDETAIGAIEAFRIAGVQVPIEVSVVGFDGTFILGVPAFQLTTMKVPLYEIGRSAAKMLVDWIDNPTSQPQDICLPTILTLGGSSGPCQNSNITSAELSAV